MPAATDAAALRVTVIADNRDTVDALHSYLLGTGLRPRTTRELDDDAAIPDAVCAVVLFPDGFDPVAVEKWIVSLRQKRPRVLLVVVTRAARLFPKVLGDDGRSLQPVVLPRPAFGWAILDAIRTHARSTH